MAPGPPSQNDCRLAVRFSECLLDSDKLVSIEPLLHLKADFRHIAHLILLNSFGYPTRNVRNGWGIYILIYPPQTVTKSVTWRGSRVGPLR